MCPDHTQGEEDPATTSRSSANKGLAGPSWGLWPSCKRGQMSSALTGLTRVRAHPGWAVCNTDVLEEPGDGELSGLGTQGVHWEILMFRRKKPQVPPQF